MDAAPYVLQQILQILKIMASKMQREAIQTYNIISYTKYNYLCLRNIWSYNEDVNACGFQLVQLV